MKVLLLGKNGMLGSSFLEILSKDEKFDLQAFGRDELDILDEEKLEKVFASVSPDIVINCTAYTDVDGAESNGDLAFSVNAEAVEKIAKLSDKYGTKLIHFSTDYVFDGENKNGYNEDALPDPINVYGESKLAGEKAVAENCEKYYIVRTSWLFGPGGRNFVDTMLSLAATKSEIEVVSDQIGSPTYSKDLAEAVIENFIDERPEFGIYHLTNSGVCSWYQFAKEIFRVGEASVKVTEIGSASYSRQAKRPVNSVLVSTKPNLLRDWREALASYLLDNSEERE